jgi:hypothetical protein
MSEIRTEVGYVAYDALEDGARGKPFGDVLPGILHSLAQPQAYALVLLVYAEDYRLDLIANREYLRRVLDPMGPRHLGYVDKALDAFLELDECAVVHYRDDRTDYLRTLFVPGFDVLPRVCLELLHPERDAFPFGVEVENHYLDFIADGKYVGRVPDASPRDVGDME